MNYAERPNRSNATISKTLSDSTLEDAMNRNFALPLAVLVVLSFFSCFALAQEKQDPFGDGTSKPFTKQQTKAKREKVVVHLPTLDLAFRWLDMNSGLVQIQRKISHTKKKIESPETTKESAEKLGKRLEQLTSTYEDTKRSLDQIPYKSTFDLERWLQFKEQLKQLRMVETEKSMIEESLYLENKSLRDENQKLRDEIARLKNGE